MLYGVIMAGGSGTRFWPASRMKLPKQLLALASDRTMIQATWERVRDLVPPERALIVTNAQLADAIAQQLADVPRQAVLGEPCKRDTAPCIGLAAAIIARQDPEGVMVVLPSDHVIRPTDVFQDAVRRAVQLVETDPRQLVTFGVRPTYPAESYGYIERGERLGPEGVYGVRMFREKPNASTAQQYVASGNFYWNSGIFVWRARTIVEALQKFEPEMCEHLTTIAGAFQQANFDDVFQRSFAQIRGKSIDYAVMEKYDRVAMIEASFEWDDVGSWGAIGRLRGADSEGNTIVGRHLGWQTRGCTILNDEDHLVATLGLEDCIVVRTPDATLVARKQDEESVRQLVEALRQRGWTEYL